MKKQLFITLLAFVGSTVSLLAQLTISNGSHVLELSGLLSTTYTQRFLPAGSDNFKKDVIGLNSARFKLEGRVGANYEYQLQMDFSRLGFTADGEFPPILDANFTYKGFPLFDIEVGYQKVPYSRSNLTPFTYQAFWQRAEIARGSVFSRRDVGVCLSKDLWKQRINLTAGAFSGQGEYILTSLTGGDNDPSGKLEYIGRADIAWPCRYRYSDVLDVTHVSVPMFALGLNARYSERAQSLAAGLVDYNLKLVAGRKTSLGFDIAAQYKGFSALFEMHQMTLRPDSNGFSNTKPLLQGKPTSYMRFGGVVAQLAYYNRKIKSGFLIRYDEFDPNDLIVNNTERTISYGYNFLLNGFKSMIRVQYWQRVGPWSNGSFQAVDRTAGLLRVDDQIRVGWQYAF